MSLKFRLLVFIYYFYIYSSIIIQNKSESSAKIFEGIKEEKTLSEAYKVLKDGSRIAIKAPMPAALATICSDVP